MADHVTTGYRTYRVRYLSPHQASPGAVKDSVNPDYWVCEDLIPAVDADSAMRQLIGEGNVPLQAKEVRRKAGSVSSDYRLKFMMSILFAVQAGSSVGSAMERTIESEVWPMRGRLDPALRLLRAGSTFSEAMAILGMYDETTLAILSAGEQTGTMSQALATAIQHLQRKSSADALMKSAVTMMTLDIVMAMTSSMTAVFGLLPQAETQGIQTKDPMALAKWDTAISLGYWSNGILLAFAFIALVFAFLAWVGYEYGKPATKEKVERVLRKLPFLGQALIHDAVSVSTGIAGHLLKGGVLFTSAMEVTARAIKLPVVKRYWTDVLSLTMGGAPTTVALARDPMSLSEQRVLASHTNAVQLSEAFHHISEFRQAQAAKANKKFIALGLIASFVYSGLGIASTLYVNYIQISTIMASSGL